MLLPCSEVCYALVIMWTTTFVYIFILLVVIPLSSINAVVISLLTSACLSCLPGDLSNLLFLAAALLCVIRNSPKIVSNFLNHNSCIRACAVGARIGPAEYIIEGLDGDERQGEYITNSLCTSVHI